MIPIIRSAPGYAQPLARSANALAELINRGSMVSSDTIKVEKLSNGQNRLSLARRPSAAVIIGMGPCCYSDGSCFIQTEADCLDDCGGTCEAGVYQGDGTVCDPNPCPPP